jgi:hypothetical protein
MVIKEFLNQIIVDFLPLLSFSFLLEVFSGKLKTVANQKYLEDKHLFFYMSTIFDVKMVTPRGALIPNTNCRS